MRLIHKRLITDTETPVSMMLKLSDKFEHSCLLESVLGGETRGRYSVIALGAKHLWECREGKIFIDNKKQIITDNKPDDVVLSFKNFIKKKQVKIPMNMPPMSAAIFGYGGYDMVAYTDKIKQVGKDVLSIPEAKFFIPEITIVFDSVKGEIIITTLTSDKSENMAKQQIDNIIEQIYKPIKHKIINYQNKDNLSNAINFKNVDHDKEKYYEMVKGIKAQIESGEIYQLVLSRRFLAEFRNSQGEAISPLLFYRNLRHLNPSPFLFYFNMGGFHLIGSSPEIMVRVRDGKVVVRPIAGTRKRGINKIEDEKLATELLADEKEKSEHLMLLDLGRNDVGKVAKTGTVKVTEKMMVEKYSHVMHIVSNVEGDLDEKFDIIDALFAGFPAGTVSGAPKIRAMEIINETETIKRSFYAGFSGYISLDYKNLDTCINLRTALIKDGKIFIQAGGGIVADSNERDEFIETENKAKALIQAANICFN